jgi:hypothetical protein
MAIREEEWEIQIFSSMGSYEIGICGKHQTHTIDPILTICL